MSKRLEFLHFGRSRSRSRSTSRPAQEENSCNSISGDGQTASKPSNPQTDLVTTLKPLLDRPRPNSIRDFNLRGRPGHDQLELSGQLEISNERLLQLPSPPQASSSGGSSKDDAAAKFLGRLGLTVIHEPTNRNLDVILVHGLGGGSRKTWCYKKNPNIFWPEWLPQIPTLSRARISTFGYNAEVIAHTGYNQANVESFAKQLLHSLTMHGQRHGKFGRAPIVFICHSMGGLVVKKACVKARVDPGMGDLALAISGILFLGTPHRGSAQARKLNSLVTILGRGGAGRAYVQDIMVDSALLQALNDDFRHLATGAKAIKLFSFAEQKKTRIGTFEVMIVEPFSAILGYPEEGSAPLFADHHLVCKYSSPVDPNYMAVTGTLVSMVDQILEESKLSTSTVWNGCKPALGGFLSVIDTLVSVMLEHALIPGDRKQHVEEIYQFLLTPNLAATEADFYALQGKRLEGSCQWVAHQTWFTYWQQGGLGPQSDIIWLNGPPGTGKSVISTFLIDQLKQSGHPCYYYFFKSSDASKRSLERCLLSIAYQISLAERAVREKLRELYDSQFHLLGTELLLLWHKVFVASVLPIYEAERLPLFLILDGLDEAENSQSIFTLLNTLRHLRYGLRICITSRPSVELAHQFSRLGDQVRVSTHRISAKDNIGDITCLIETTLSGLPLSSEVRRQILDSIIQKAEGNILWVEMVSREMLEAGFNEESLLQVLQQVPPGMDQIYANTLARLKSLPAKQKEIARWIILWTLSSFQPLRLSQLQEALQFGPPAEKVEALEYWLTKLCGNIVVVDREKHVQPLHATAREFLLADTTTGYAITADTHLHIAKVCLESILKANQLQNARKMQPESKVPEKMESTGLEENLAALPGKANLWTYAVFWWSDHLAAASSQDADIAVFGLLMRVLKSPKFMDCIREIAESGDLHPLIRIAENLKRYINFLNTAAVAERKDDLKVIGSWASDLRRLTTEFGTNLVRFPSLVNTIIPPFCPRSSTIYRRFGARERGIVLLGDVSMHWDTRLALLNPENTATPHAATTVSASSKLVAIGYQNGLITLWNSTTALLVHGVNLSVPVSCLTFNHTGSCIAAGGRGSIKCWNPSTAVEQLSLAVTDAPVLLEFSDDDSLLFVIFRCNKLQVYNIEDCSVIAEFDWGDEKLSTNIVGGFPLCVSLNSQRTRMAVAYRGFPVSIWDIEKKCYLKKIRLASSDLSHRLVQRGGKAGFTTYTHDSVQTIAYHSVTDELFLNYMAGTFVKWDPETNEQVTAPINLNVHVMKCSPDGTLLVTGNSVGQIQFWSTTTLELLFSLEDDIDGDSVRKLCLSTDGGRIFDIRGVYCNIWEPEILQQGSRIYRETRPSLTTLPQERSHNFTPTSSMTVTCLSPSPDGSYFIVGTENGHVVLYSMASGKRLKVLYSHGAFAVITSIIWSKDGQFLATGDTSSMVLVYRVTIFNGRTKIPTEPLQANYGDFEIDSDYDDANFLALESALEITATEILRGLAKVAGRRDGLINSLLLSENNDLIMVSTLNADSVWQLNHSREVTKKSTKGVDSCLTICYGGEKRRQLLQHPQDTDSIMIVAPDSVRILSWSAIKSTTKKQEQQAPHSVDYNTFRDQPFLSEYSTNGETSSPKQGIWELERSCLGVVGNYHVLVTCLSTPRVRQPGRRREISIWRIDGTSDNSIISIRSPISLSTSDTATTIHSLLGISAGKIYFLDTNGCLCSQDINLEELTGQKEALRADVSDLAVWFCLPRGQVTPELSSTISCAIVWNQDVVFTRKEKVTVVKRGLRGQGIKGSSK